MHYQVYQIAAVKVNKYGFMSWNYAMAHGFDFNDYVDVYQGCIQEEVDESTDLHKVLDNLYEQLNMRRPSDFRAHSLSMSDIVKLTDNNNDRYFYCDTTGWREITDVILPTLSRKRMNLKERAELVRAMELIARSVNDEEAFMLWLSLGVADGDIDEDTEDDELECYCEDDTLSDLMTVFLNLMDSARKDGGLYCDGIVSK